MRRRQSPEQQAVREIRAARRQRYVEDLDVMEILYRVYLGVLGGGFALAVIAGAVADAKVTDETVRQIAAHGPAYLGLGVAIALAAALRSGAAGGPIAIERADVHHVLLAPVDRGWVLRGPAVKQLRS